MQLVEESAQEVIAAIRTAFAGVSRDGGVSLHQTRVLDDCGTDEEMARAATMDTDTAWENVPREFMETSDLHSIFLDEIGFRYYLPVYMVLAVREISEGLLFEGDTRQLVSFDLTLDKDRWLRKKWRRRFALLTPAQSRAVLKFLDFYAEFANEYHRPDAHQAIARYWFKFR